MSGSIRCVSQRRGGTTPRPGEVVVNIDRTNPVLGNRHVLVDHLDPEERARVISAHRRDMEADLAAGGPKTQALRRIAERVKSGQRVALACWCAPRACHGDVYVEIVKGMVEGTIS